MSWITLILSGLPWKRTAIILLFLRLHPSTAFRTLLLTMLATPLFITSNQTSFNPSKLTIFTHKIFYQENFVWVNDSSSLLLNPSLCSQSMMRLNQPKHLGFKEQRVYCRVKQGEQVACAQKPQTPWWFWGRVFAFWVLFIYISTFLFILGCVGSVLLHKGFL